VGQREARGMEDRSVAPCWADLPSHRWQGGSFWLGDGRGRIQDRPGSDPERRGRRRREGHGRPARAHRARAWPGPARVQRRIGPRSLADEVKPPEVNCRICRQRDRWSEMGGAGGTRRIKVDEKPGHGREERPGPELHRTTSRCGIHWILDHSLLAERGDGGLEMSTVGAVDWGLPSGETLLEPCRRSKRLAPCILGSSSRSGTSMDLLQTDRSTRQVLLPPNPNEFERTTFTG
jgi:hypothetical protein